jgi:fructose-1,6-bisphosphatase I
VPTSSLLQKADFCATLRSQAVCLSALLALCHPQGEEQKKLDVISNDIFCNCLRNSGRTGVIASEEEATPVAVQEATSGNYIVVFDPLDGSSNIDAGECLPSWWMADETWICMG